jgi:hypothetical protein
MLVCQRWTLAAAGPGQRLLEVLQGSIVPVVQHLRHPFTGTWPPTALTRDLSNDAGEVAPAVRQHDLVARSKVVYQVYEFGGGPLNGIVKTMALSEGYSSITGRQLPPGRFAALSVDC